MSSLYIGRVKHICTWSLGHSMDLGWDRRDRISTGEYIHVSVNFEYYYRMIIKTVLYVTE